MPTIIRSIAAANARLNQLGQKSLVFRNLKQAQAAVDAAEKRATIKTPAIAAKVATPGSKPSIGREAIFAAIAGEKSPGLKADLYGKLSASYLDEIKALPADAMVKKTELTRAFSRAQKNQAYSLSAEASLDPKAARARKMMS